MSFTNTKLLRLAVIGVGRVGQACAELIALSHDLRVGAFVRRSASGVDCLPDHLRHIPLLTHVGQVREVDGALICVPTNAVMEAASQILRHGIPIVDCAFSMENHFTPTRRRSTSWLFITTLRPLSAPGGILGRSRSFDPGWHCLHQEG